MLNNKSSLYRIYRPSTFADVAGHQNVVEILRKELISQKMSHAFLFAGQKGTGKTSIARILAKAVNCENLIEGEPCQNCENCLLANEGRMPDIYEIDAASNNGVDEIRNIKNNVATLPLKGKYKIYIIDEVHMLSKGAFNALLKTLEEPPIHALFILATTEFAKIPQTIVSRCQTFNFKKIDKKSLLNRLYYIVEKENFVLNVDVAEEIYFLSDGSLRDALNILEQLMIINEHEISLTSLKKIFYVASKQEKLKVINDVLKNDAQDLISYFENAENQGMDFDVFALSLIEILKEIIEFKITNDAGFLKLLTVEEVEELNGDLEQYFFLADRLSETYAQTKGTNVSFNYILIGLLKAIKPNITKIDVPVIIEEPILEEKENLIAEVVENDLPVVEPIVEQKTTKIEIKKSTINLDQLMENKLKLVSLFASKKYMIINNNDVVNLLVEATKEKRDAMNQLVESWFAVDEQNNLKNQKLASQFIAFYGSKVVAVSDCEILVRFETEPGANLLKKELMSVNYQKELMDVFGGDYVFYVIDEDQWETIKKEFLFKKKAKSLPKHNHQKSVEFYRSAIIKEKKSDQTEEFLEKASQLFGDDLEIGD